MAEMILWPWAVPGRMETPEEQPAPREESERDPVPSDNSSVVSETGGGGPPSGKDGQTCPYL